MRLPDGQLDSLRNGATALLEGLAPGADCAADPGLGVLSQGFDRLFDVVARAEADLGSGGQATADNITGLGTCALQLSGNLASRVGGGSGGDSNRTLALLNIDIALWTARHGGTIELLEPVVDALVLVANSTTQTMTLSTSAT